MSRASPTTIPTLNPSPPPSLSLKVCVGATVLLYQCQGFLHPSPHPKPQSPQSKPKGVCGCYSAAVSISGAPHTPVPTLNPSPTSLSLKVCVGATVLLYQCQDLPSLSLKVCVGATVLLYQCQGLPPPQYPP